jgi:hypothetical protein
MEKMIYENGYFKILGALPVERRLIQKGQDIY